jgi:hypothetical protein
LLFLFPDLLDDAWFYNYTIGMLLSGRFLLTVSLFIFIPMTHSIADVGDVTGVSNDRSISTGSRLAGSWFNVDDVSGMQQVDRFYEDGRWSTITSLPGDEDDDYLKGSWSLDFHYTDSIIQVSITFDPELTGSIDTVLEYIIEFTTEDQFTLYTTHFNPETRLFETESSQFYRLLLERDSSGSNQSP